MTMPRLTANVEWGPIPHKPEPSLTMLGRAKAKGTVFDYVDPRLSMAYVLDKEGYQPTYTMPRAQVDDVTATPLMAAILQRMRGQSPETRLLALLGLDRP